MAQELETKSTDDSKVVVDKSLINNKFETYKLSFDYIINSVKNNAEQKESVNGSTISKKIQLSNEHQHIQLKNRISNVSKLENIIKMNYLFMINDTPFFYDTTGIFMVNDVACSIHQIYQFSKDIDVANLSVTGFYDTQITHSSNYFVIFSHSNNKICLLKFDMSFTKVSTLFNDKINDINAGFIIQNGYYSKQDKIYCSVLSWQKNAENKSFNPTIDIISFDINTNNKQSNASYSICCEFKGAKKYFKCFFDQLKQTFWMISNGKFRCKDTNHTMESKDNEIIYGNDVDSDWTVIQCFDISSMKIIHTINFDDCLAWKIMSINCFTNEKNESDDRLLCVIGCELSHDMVVFNLLGDDKNGYLFKHKGTFPGLSMIAKSRKNKKEVLINAESQNVFIVQHKQYISSFVNPKCNNIGIQDSLQLTYNESYVGTKIIGNKLYCLTNFNFYIFHLPHING